MNSVGDGTVPLTDVAVDPIDGTTLTAYGRANAIAVIAVSERGTMFDPGPCVYMHKIAVGPEAAGSIDITATPTQNLRWIAKAKGESVRDLTVVILDRERHTGLIAEVRASGARVKLITDGDIFGAIATRLARRRRRRLAGHRRHARRRHGGSRAEVHGRRDPRSARAARRGRATGRYRSRLRPVAPSSPQTTWSRATTASSRRPASPTANCLRGVRYERNGARTQSLVMRSKSGTVRMIDARHRIDKLSAFAAVDYA